METPRIYVGTYGKYNNCSIDGKWIDLLDYSNKEDFYTYCAELHNDEEEPEFMFQDYENIPESLIGESWLSDNIFEYFELLEKIDNEDAFLAFISNYGYDLNSEDISSLEDKFTDSFQGEFRSEEDFAYDIAEQTLEIPDNISSYFDYEKFARDLFMDGYTFIDGYVFSDNF